MLLAVPYQTIELAKLYIDPFSMDRRDRTSAPLTYRDSALTFHGCSILTPAMPLLSYDTVSNRLQFDLTGQRVFSHRLHAIQDHIANHLFAHRRQIFTTDYSLRDIHGLLQKLYTPSTLSVYAYPTTPVGCTSDPRLEVQTIKPGSAIRFVLRLHGLLLLENRGVPHVRIQHSLVSVRNSSDA